MSHNTTSGGGRTTRSARARSTSSPPCRKPARKVAAMSMRLPWVAGRSRRVRRRSSGRRRRRISSRAAVISAALIASKSIVCSRSESLTVRTASISGASSVSRRSRRSLNASATRRLPAAGRASDFGALSPSSAIAASNCAAAGSRQNKSNAPSNTSACSCRCTMVARRAVRMSAREATPVWSSAATAASISAGPTGSPARAQQPGELQHIGCEGAAGLIFKDWRGLPSLSGPNRRVWLLWPTGFVCELQLCA